MIQETLLRLEGLDLGKPIVSCGESHRFLVSQQVGEVSKEKPCVILEPCAKNTAPAIAAACAQACKLDSDCVVIILPSDHVIRDAESFRKAVQTAALEAYNNNTLVTFGIVPTFPATGYGYVKAGEKSGDVYNLDSFVEKPCLEKAQEYLASGLFSWNSGMFVFRPQVFIEELKKHSPSMAELSLASFEKAKTDDDFIRLDSESFSKIEGDSIDYAVMEKTRLGRIVKLDAGWDDVGSWSALYDISKKDENQNVIKGDVICLDSKKSYIRSENSRPLAVIGLENLVVVDSPDGLLISAIDKIQDVKKVTEALKKRS